MFGYITINRDEMKVRDYEAYNHFYCGLCQDLKQTCGQRSRATLTYDMTFLAILLTGLYEEEPERETHRCAFHAGARRICYRSKYTAYAADMNLLLVYHNLIDDWIDEKNRKSLAAARLLTKPYRLVAARYPEKVQAIRAYLRALHRAERSRSEDIDLASGLTGTLMREIFTVQDDRWSRDLGEVGFYLGKFIYLKDAFDDLEKDRENGTYNPFFALAESEDFQKKANEILTMMAASAARAFERLPIVSYVDILRNIIYTGLWTEVPDRRCRSVAAARREQIAAGRRRNDTK
ncbi:MAG: hypothetical protein IJ860_04265 [Eubacterium sp.]|nr:hypothetical protein [Eubacterium sp.]